MHKNRSSNYAAISSTSELKTKLGKVVVMSLHFYENKISKCQLTEVIDNLHDGHYNKKYLKYGRVIIFSNEGFFVTKLSHSDLSIFPSRFTSASKNVCSQNQTKKY